MSNIANRHELKEALCLFFVADEFDHMIDYRMDVGGNAGVNITFILNYLPLLFFPLPLQLSPSV